MITKRIKEIRDSINKDVELVAVSKTKSNKKIFKKIENRIKEIRDSINKNVELVAVS